MILFCQICSYSVLVIVGVGDFRLLKKSVMRVWLLSGVLSAVDEVSDCNDLAVTLTSRSFRSPELSLSGHTAHLSLLTLLSWAETADDDETAETAGVESLQVAGMKGDNRLMS